MLHNYEREAVKIMMEHGGKITKVLHPVKAVGQTALPDEIHYLELVSQEAFDNFRADPRLNNLSDLRDGSVKEVSMIFGEIGVNFYEKGV